MKKLVYTAMIALAGFTARAQKHDIAGAAQIQVTYRQYDLGQLNSALNANGLPSLSNNSIWINASMSHIHKKWLFEDGIGFTPLSTSEANNIKSRFNQYQVYFRAAYDLSNSTNYRVFPFVGLNFSEAVLNIQDKAREQNVSNFNQELLNSTSSKTLFQPNLGIELGAGLDFVLKMKPKTMDCVTIQRNIPIGIRAGYYINAYSGDWRINDYKLNNSPTNSQSAVFVSLNIGLGYAIKK